MITKWSEMPPLSNSSRVSAIATTSQRPSTVATIDPLSGCRTPPSLQSLEGQWLFHRLLVALILNLPVSRFQL